MATITTDLICNLNQPVAATFLHGNLFSQDNAGNTINVHVMDNGEPATIGGTVSANVIRADGNTVAVSGAIDGNKAYVILPQACYAVPGRVEIIIKLTQNTTITTIAAIVANVYRSTTDTVVDPGTIIPSIQTLIAEIEEAVDSIPVDYSGLLATIAADYSSSKTYPVVGMYAWQGGVLKRNIVPITTAETYTAAHWTNAVLGDDVSALKSALSDLTNNVADVTETDIPKSMSTGVYIAADGSVVSAGTNYWASNLLDIAQYVYLIVSGAANYTHLIYAFYDANETFLSGLASAGGESTTNIVLQTVRIPENAKYIRVSNTATSGVSTTKVYGITISVKGINELSEVVDDVTNTEQYTIDVVESVSYTSGYINKSGTSGSGSYVHTDKITVKPGDVIKVINTISGSANSMRFVCAYNASNSAVSASGAENTTSYTVPNGIASIIVTVASTSTPTTTYAIHHTQQITQNVLDAPNMNDVLFGKKWCVCGDSFSYGGQSVMPVFADGKYAGCRKVYPYFIGNRTHIDIIDFTANGRTLAYPSDGTFSNSLTNPSEDDYYQNIPSDADYITIYLGINDSHHAPGSSGGDGEDNTGEIPIGTVDDATTATFGGAWNVVLSWLITNRPNAHIGIIVSNGVDNVNYRTLTINIAKKYGIAYIDLNGDERTPAMLRTVNPNIASAVKTALINKWAVNPSTNTHPNTDAHEYESFFIENFLRSI